MFLDPATLRPADVAERVYAGMTADPDWAHITHQEFLASQIEHASVVFTDLDVARDALTTFRRKLAAEADALGVIVAGIGTPPPDALPFPSITHQARYERIVRDMNGSSPIIR